nr:hypothetical protein CFP56_32497 [Quercus suber]
MGLCTHRTAVDRSPSSQPPQLNCPCPFTVCSAMARCGHAIDATPTLDDTGSVSRAVRWVVWVCITYCMHRGCRQSTRAAANPTAVQHLPCARPEDRTPAASRIVPAELSPFQQSQMHGWDLSSPMVAVYKRHVDQRTTRRNRTFDPQQRAPAARMMLADCLGNCVVAVRHLRNRKSRKIKDSSRVGHGIGRIPTTREHEANGQGSVIRNMPMLARQAGSVERRSGSLIRDTSQTSNAAVSYLAVRYL